MLEFGEDEEESDAELEYDEADDVVSSKELVDVTSDIFEECTKAATKGSLGSLKKLLSIFRAACIPSGDVDRNGSGENNRFTVNSPEVYEQVMVGTIDTAHKAFYAVLGICHSHKEFKEAELLQLGQHSKWKKVQVLVLSFFKSVMHTLSSLFENASQQGQVTAYLIAAMEPYIPLLAPTQRLTRNLLKLLLTVWSEGPLITEDAHSMQGHAFLRVRQMALVLPGTVTEECFRSVYLAFTRHCKSFSEQGGASVLFMTQCIVELYRTNVVQAYQNGFLYIRQLALYLRNAIVKKAGEPVKQVLSWQYLNCLRLWTRVICSMPGSGNDELGELCYPLVQVLFGAMSLAQSSVYYPFRLHILGCIHQLAAHCNAFVPTSAKLMDILEEIEAVAKPAASTDAAPKLAHIVKFLADAVERAPVRDAVVTECVALMRQEAEIYRFCVGYPEYSFMTLRRLRGLLKKCKVSKWRDVLKTLAGQISDFVAQAKKARGQLQVDALAKLGFEPLLPAGVPVAAVRLHRLPQKGMSSKMLTSNEVTANVAPAAQKVKFARPDSDDSESEGDYGSEEHSDSDEEQAERKAKSAKKSKMTKKQKKSDKSALASAASSSAKKSEGGSIDSMEDRVSAMDWSDSEAESD